MHLDQNEQERTDVTDAVRLEKVTCKKRSFFVKKFSVGDDIAFKVFNTTTCYMDYYIGRIIKITDDNLALKDVEINRESISTEIEVPFNVIIPNSYNYVHKES